LADSLLPTDRVKQLYRRQLALVCRIHWHSTIEQSHVLSAALLTTTLQLSNAVKLQYGRTTQKIRPPSLSPSRVTF